MMNPKTLYLLSLLLLFNTLKAQKNTEKQNYYTIYVNYPDYTVRAAIRKKPATFKANTERPYFWYAANQINSTQGGYDGKLLHGNYAAFYLNNNLKEKGRFENGLKEGKWHTWHADGKLSEVVRYNKGLRSGKYESYDSKGRPVVKATFKNGKLHGKSETYVNGELSATRYYKDGEERIPKTKKELLKSRDALRDSVNNVPGDSIPDKKRLFKSRDASRDNPNSDRESRDNTQNEKKPAAVEEKKNSKRKSQDNEPRNEKKSKRKSRDASRDNPNSDRKSRDASRDNK